MQFLQTGRFPIHDVISLQKKKTILAWKIVDSIIFSGCSNNSRYQTCTDPPTPSKQTSENFCLAKLSRMPQKHWATQAKGSSCHLKELSSVVLLGVAYLNPFDDIKALHPLYTAQLKITNR